MDIYTIEDTIDALENSETTLDNIQLLASLYIVKDKFNNSNTSNDNGVKSELDDIMPAYLRYVHAKTLYQSNELNEGAVIKELKSLCTEIQEFIDILYSCTDMNRERTCIKDTICSLHNKYLC